ncbi:MAG: RagB/SusD family nutrient uptake outer membrane protein, partial [Weeksellaceae bacterium]|nr:RagB/SusD family nutrient uptake outer membrane protein [Weeksellaceae bacterium]
MKYSKYKTITIAAVIFGTFATTSCVNDLEQVPITDVTSISVFSDFANYPNALAKLYGGLAHGG